MQTKMASRECQIVKFYKVTAASEAKHNTIPYHHFLKDHNLCERWEKALWREENAFREVIRQFVCGEHFLRTNYCSSLVVNRFVNDLKVILLLQIFSYIG